MTKNMDGQEADERAPSGIGRLAEDYPLVLDLFCGVGGVARGFHQYGHRPFWEAIGIDSDGSKADQSPGHFIAHDLTNGLPEEIEGIYFDVAWASPPCTFATGTQFARSGENYIPLARDLLADVNAEMKVIENVEGARSHLRDPVRFCGSAFDLGVRKHRLFETNFWCHGTQCDHPDRFEFCIGDRERSVEEYRAAHGFQPAENLTAKQVRECIPPAYITELVDQYTRISHYRRRLRVTGVLPVPTDNSPDSTEHTSLLALASHVAGDFPLQTNRMASEKFENSQVRAEHVSVYTASFLPFTVAMDWTNRQRATFLCLLWGSHFVIDTRRWAENYEGFPTRSLWFDQAFHIIALALAVVLTEVIE